MRKENEKANVTTTNTIEPTTTSTEIEAYCVKCKTKHPILDHEKVTMKNGKNALKGKCKNCNTTVYKLTKKEEPIIT